ncbi:hypothetical protein [Streptomyces sp. NPDC054838]
MYRSRTNSSACSWKRSKDASGESGSIIATDVESGGSTYVLLKPGDFFDTDHCTTWLRVQSQN